METLRPPIVKEVSPSGTDLDSKTVQSEVFFENAIKKERLGKGAQSIVYLMESESDGASKEFVRKIFTNNPVSQIKHEYDALERMTDVGCTPTPFRMDQKTLDMEFMKGIPLGRLKPGKRDQIPTETLAAFKDAVITALSRGVINTDFNVNNVILNQENNTLGWVDFGGVRLVDPENLTRKDVKAVLGAIRKTFPRFPGLADSYEELEIILQRKLR